MPFQISLFNGSKDLGAINSYTAGPDQYATCASQVTLTAVVDGNLGGHTIGWEQIGGDAQILFITPVNQLSATYIVLGGGSSDRTFRFYIDKGTSIEQFDDITAWGTPTEQETSACSIVVGPTVTDIDCHNIPCSSITIKYPVDPPSIMGTYIVNPQTGYTLTWSNPTCDLTWFTSTTVIHNSGGNLINLGNIPAGINAVTLPSLTDVYYLYTNYQRDQTISTQYSCRFINALQTDTVMYTTDTETSAGNILSSVSATYYTLISMLPPPQDTSYDAASILGSITATYYVLSAAPISTSTDVGGLSLINTLSITYYSNNGIGG